MSRLKIYRRYLLAVLFLSLGFIGVFGFHSLKSSIPDEIRIIADKEQSFSFNIPGSATIYNQNSIETSDVGEADTVMHSLELSLKKMFTFYSESTGIFSMNCKLFGVIPLKTVSVEVVNEQYLTPGGIPIGIYIETEGVLIIGTGTVTSTDGLNYEPAHNLVHSGDYITKINEMEVTDKDSLMEYLNMYGSEEIVLTVMRDQEEIKIKLKAVQTGQDEYKLGIWVRDNTQGIGTLTYVDTNNNFGALGHGISDSDTGTLMNLKSGLLYEAQIMSIVKGENGSPGGLEGVIQYDDRYLLGEITNNTSAGIFGTVYNLSNLGDIYTSPMEICLKQDIQTGPATILSTVGGEVCEYSIEILDINIAEDNVNKGIVLQITDSQLLQQTGGIVQGMSGSPILQNGKIVGAVTHVFVQDSRKGYGIFIENMLEMSK